jgi:hypothetical protein
VVHCNSRLLLIDRLGGDPVGWIFGDDDEKTMEGVVGSVRKSSLIPRLIVECRSYDRLQEVSEVVP